MLYLWALPTTLLGLLFLPVALATGGGMRCVSGIAEVYGGAVAWFLRHCTLVNGGASAMTLGHIVLGVDPDRLDAVRAHELVHVRQCERWGPLFVPAYLLTSLWALLRGRRPYLDNAFEIQARERSSRFPGH